MGPNSVTDAQSYSRATTKMVGTYLGLTKEDLLATYGTPFNQLKDEDRLRAAMEARTQELLAKFAPPATAVGDGATTLARSHSAADGALNELTGAYGGLVEEGVRALLQAHGDEEAINSALNMLQEASTTMVLSDLERLADVIGLLMIIGQPAPADAPKVALPPTHPVAGSLQAQPICRRSYAAQSQLAATAAKHRQAADPTNR